MVAELRAVRADLFYRVKFTREGEGIVESRATLAEILDDVMGGEQRAPASGMTLETLALEGLIEVG